MSQHWLKVVLAFGLVGIALLALLVFGPRMVPASAMRNLLLSELAAQTGAEITAQTVSLQLFPSPTFEIAGVRIIPAQGSNMGLVSITAESARGDIRISNLFSGNLRTALTVHNIKLRHGQMLIATHDTNEALAIDIDSASLDHLQRLGTSGAAAKVRGTLNASTRVPFQLNATVRMHRQRHLTELEHLSGHVGDVSITGRWTLDAAVTPHRSQLEVQGQNLTANALAMLFGSSASLPPAISWKGPGTLALFVNTHVSHATVNATLDLSPAVISVGKLFSKGDGYPLVAKLEGDWSNGSLAIRTCTLDIGQSRAQVMPQTLAASDTWVWHIQSAHLDAATLRTSVPMFAGVEAIDAAQLSATIQADKSTSRLTAMGKLSARTATLLGQPLTDISLNFHLNDAVLHLNPLQGRWNQGALSSTGSIDMTQTPTYHLDAVISDVDVAQLPLLAGSLQGRGNLVHALDASGSTSTELLHTLTAQGSLVMEKAVLNNIAWANSIFSPAVWTEWEALAGHSISSDTRNTWVLSAQALQDVRLSYDLRSDFARITTMSFRSAPLTVNATASRSSDGALSGTGTLSIDAASASSLTTAVEPLLLLTSADGTLLLPLLLRGTLASPDFSIDMPTLKMQLAEAQVRQERVKQERVAEEAVKKSTAPAKPKPKTVPQASSVKRTQPPAPPTPKAPPPPPAARVLTDEQADDVLKVQISQ